jgi:hypothetical protein
VPYHRAGDSKEAVPWGSTLRAKDLLANSHARRLKQRVKSLLVAAQPKLRGTAISALGSPIRLEYPRTPGIMALPSGPSSGAHTAASQQHQNAEVLCLCIS